MVLVGSSWKVSVRLVIGRSRVRIPPRAPFPQVKGCQASRAEFSRFGAGNLRVALTPLHRRTGLTRGSVRLHRGHRRAAGGRAVDEPDIRQPAVWWALHALHRALGEPDDALEAEAAGHGRERLRAHSANRHPIPPAISRPGWPASCATCSTPGGSSRSLWPRRATCSVPHRPTWPGASRHLRHRPHQYLVARRVEAARLRLLDGQPIARVAAEVGFYDQAHFTRQFDCHVGIPPGRYALSTGDRPANGTAHPGRQRAGDGGWLSSSTCRGTAGRPRRSCSPL